MAKAKSELLLLRMDVRAYGTKLLNEAEHATEIGADDLRFASVTGAAVLEVVVRMIDKRLEKCDG